jgi:hypothetical protein
MKARLDGHEFDLQDLADWLPSGDIRVAKDDMGYYLSAAVIDNPPEGKTFYEAAHDLLPIVNGMGRLKSAKFRPVKLDGRYQDGEKRHTVVGVGTIEVRSRVHAVGIITGPDGKVKPQPPTPGIAYAGLTGRPEVAEALTILATPAGGWVELYKVYEIIRDAVSPIPLDKSGLATKEEISAFTCSANRPDVGGLAARHARIAGGLPKRTMTELQAHEFIGRLMRAWMDALVYSTLSCHSRKRAGPRPRARAPVSRRGSRLACTGRYRAR